MNYGSDDLIEQTATGYLGAVAGISLAIVVFVALAAVVFAREAGGGRPLQERSSQVAAIVYNQSDFQAIKALTGGQTLLGFNNPAAHTNQGPVVFYLVGSHAAAEALKVTLAQEGYPTANVVVVDSRETTYSIGASAEELTLAGTDAWIDDLR